MKDVLVILAHPDEKSFNFAVARRCTERLLENDYRPLFHDLYREGFDPILRAGETPEDGKVDPAVECHCEELTRAWGLVIVHPNWWGQPPAILTGWIDRVIRPGVAYRFLEGDSGEGVPEGLLKGKTALIFNTSNTAPEREAAVFGDPLEVLWGRCIFGLCGITEYYRRTFSVVVTSTLDERVAWLDEAAGVVDRYFPKE
jgi:NAD(P)H dehydrogenase (quinone)